MVQTDDDFWSGLETDGMIKAKCSLLIPTDVTHDAIVKALPQQSVMVYQEKQPTTSSSTEAEDFKKELPVDFPGATILQLEPVAPASIPSDVGETTIMPVTLTVAGRCVLTPENYTDFRLLMRTAEQSQEMNCPRNGALDWPDVTAMLQCPCCGNTGAIPCHGDKQEHEYWMVFYPLLQLSGEAKTLTLGTRTICRLVCLECMDDLLEGLSIEVAPGKRITASAEPVGVSSGDEPPASLSFTLPVSNVLTEAGSASFLEEGPPRPDTHPHVDDILDAWTLYNLWEQSGAWEALQHDYRAKLSESLQQDTANPSSSGTTKAVSLKHRLGRPCGNRECSHIHGELQQDGTCCRLYMKCRDCHSEFYCSRPCMEASVHTHNCLERRRDREERRVRTRKVECSQCSRKFPYTKMKKCSACRVATYCSVDCQRTDWQTHKFVCNSMGKR